MTGEREGLVEEIARVIADHPRLGCGCCTWSEDCVTCDSGEWVAHDCPRDLDRTESIARSVADALADLLDARDRRVRGEAVASTLRDIANQSDSIGHHWSGAPALAFFALAGDLRDRADKEADA